MVNDVLLVQSTREISRIHFPSEIDETAGAVD